MEKQYGVVIWFTGNYGFIKRDGKTDLFVHWKNILKDGWKMLKAGQKVTFDIDKNDKGDTAVNVEVTSEVL